MSLEPKQEKKQGFFSSMGLFPKIIFIIGTLIIAWGLFNGKENPSLVDLIIIAAQTAFGGLLLAFVIKMIEQIFSPKPFSPTESLRKKFIRIAKQGKPDNVKNLMLRGEDMRSFSFLGNIKGAVWIPYVTSLPELIDGKPVFELKKDRYGQKILDHEGREIKVPKMKKLIETDGEWLFVVKKGILGEEILVRANRDLVSPMHETVWIKDINVVPIGDFYYPSKQWQKEIIRIEAEHTAEALIETYMWYLDLAANVTQTTLGADPTFQKIMEANSESLANRNQGFLGGNRGD